jgi:RecA/RadA recombinase
MSSWEVLTADFKGGIKTGVVTEFCGMSETGNSQLAMTLAINAQIQQGLISESIFVCTNLSVRNDW